MAPPRAERVTIQRIEGQTVTTIHHETDQDGSDANGNPVFSPTMREGQCVEVNDQFPDINIADTD
ncbi:hypothetical protein HY032_03460 [Candidatus Gottesmanbacteria bacterium]|nr:hypothetical protein [Candidatus Gottesmanbacteria bacterium]